MKSIIIRIKYETLKELKRFFPAQRGESAAHYFQRVAEHIKQMEQIY